MIILIMPTYKDGIGDCSRVLTSEGEEFLRKRPDVVIKAIFNRNCLNYHAVRKNVEAILQKRSLLPVYASPTEILIPVKVRIPMFKGDCCYGYVNIFEIRLVGKNELLLHSGERVAFLDTKRTIQQRLRNAETIQKDMPDLFDPFMFRWSMNLNEVVDVLVKRIAGEMIGCMENEKSSTYRRH